MLAIIRAFYRYFISPFLHVLVGPGYGCRFEVTCSEYFFTKVREKGWVKGSSLGLKRLLQCQPWGKPDPIEE